MSCPAWGYSGKCGILYNPCPLHGSYARNSESEALLEALVKGDTINGIAHEMRKLEDRELELVASFVEELVRKTHDAKI